MIRPISTPSAAALRLIPPPYAPWGHEYVKPTREIVRRIVHDPKLKKSAVLVLGAGGALGPAVLNALKLRGYGTIVGADRQLTYIVEGVPYQRLDTNQNRQVRAFIAPFSQRLSAMGVKLRLVIDLTTIQTNPVSADRKRRQTPLRNQRSILAELAKLRGTVRYVYMSTAEVYGAPSGAPYAEEHAKRPFNAYGRAKLAEEIQVLGSNGTATRRGRILTTALRSWTISMVSEDGNGTILSARNYNDPMIFLAYRLACLGIRLPLADPKARAQFHREEDIVESLVLMAGQPAGSPVWGHAYNCIGQPTTHGDLRRVFDGLIDQFPQRRSVWRWILRPLSGTNLPPVAIRLLSVCVQHLGTWSGLRQVSSRLPFLYRSVDIDSSALRSVLGDQFRHPEGGTSEDAARRLITGLLRGGESAINFRRYTKY